MAELLSSWLVEQEDRGSIPGLASWIFRDWLSPASKSRYDWKIAKSTLILKNNQQQQLMGVFPGCRVFLSGVSPKAGWLSRGWKTNKLMIHQTGVNWFSRRWSVDRSVWCVCTWGAGAWDKDTSRNAFLIRYREGPSKLKCGIFIGLFLAQEK